MRKEDPITFGSFCLDIVNERLCREDEEVHLHPKAFAVLRYLIEHSGRLVTRNALLETVWAGLHVTDAVLTESMKEIRKVS